MEHSYYLILKRKRKRAELSFNVGSREKTTTLLKLGGENVLMIFNKIITILSRAGCSTPIETGKTSIYWIRDDVGPVLGAYLILIRRGRNLRYWLNFLDELLTGKYSILGGLFSTLLESAIELSKDLLIANKKEAYTLSPAVLSSFSSALKTFVRVLKKHGNS